MNRQQRLAAIFADTQDMIANTPRLRETQRRAADATHVISADEWPDMPEHEGAGEVRVSELRSFEAARIISQERPDARICVHNFASPVQPGGGVLVGSSAQEESLCRCSTLLACLDQHRIWDGYYSLHRGSKNALASDACIYTPGVVVCKSDTDFPERLPEDAWYTVDVLTCAAPDLRGTTSNLSNPGSSKVSGVPLTRIYEIHRRRAQHLLQVAASEGARCLVLGAFGCGAFRNDPYLVASAWKEPVEKYRSHFDLIEFAIFHMPYEQENYEAFRAEFAS